MCSCFDVLAVRGSCMWRDVERTVAKMVALRAWRHDSELCLCVNYTGLDVRVLGIEICV